MGMIQNFISKIMTSPEQRAESALRAIANYPEASSRMDQSNIGKSLGKYADQAWVYSCVSIIQTKAASVPLKVYKKQEDNLVWIENHPLQELLDSVNPIMNGYDLMESTHGFRELAGNAYWLLDSFVGGKPKEIYPLNPSNIKIIPDKQKLVAGYELNFNGVRQTIFAPEEIIHFKNWNPIDPLYGMAPICAARDSSDMIYYSDQYNKTFFKNGAQPSGVLETDKMIDPEEVRRISSNWNKKHSGPSNSNKVAVLYGGLKFIPTLTSNQDMQFTELKRMSREDVLTVYHVPPVMVGIFDEANYSNADVQRKIFWVDCIIPRLMKIESVLNERLAKLYGADIIVKHDLSGIQDIAEDANKRAQADSWNVGAGIVTINEVRKEKKLPPVEWGDTWNAPFGLAPISDKGDNSQDSPPANDPTSGKAIPQKAVKDAPSVESVENSPIVAEVDENVVRRDNVWVKYKGLSEREEKKWTSVMRRLFADQEREVIGNIQASDWQRSLNQNKLDHFKNMKASVDVILFDRTRARSIFRREANTLLKITLSEAANEAIQDYGLGIDFNLSNPKITAWINEKSFKFAEEVNKTTEESLRRALEESIKAGEPIAETEKRIADVFDIARGSRTAMIARTEVLSASNRGSFDAFMASDVVSDLEWITSRDNRVRETHQIDGETTAKGSTFSNGLKYPGDSEGGPEEVINCRCTVAGFLKREERQ